MRIKNNVGEAEQQWVKAGTDKPASNGSVSITQMIIAFMLCIFVGMYLNKVPAVDM